MMMMMMMFYLSDDGRRLAAGEFLQFRNFQSDIDERLQRDLRVDALLRLVGFVLLDVHSHRGARGTGTRQTEDESRTVREDESNALFRGDGTVNRVGVFKVVRVVQLVRAVLVPFFRFARFFAQGFNHLVARIGFAPFVIVSGEEVSAVRLPMRLGDFLDADEFPTFRDVLVSLGQNGQPRQDGPRSIFLSDVVRAGTERLLATNRALAGVHQVAKIFPSGWSFKALDVQLLSDSVQCGRSWHGSRDAFQARLEVWDALLRVGGDNRDGIRRRDEKVVPQNHVTVTVAIGGGAKVRRVLGKHNFHKLFRVRQVWIRVTFVKVFQRRIVDARTRRCAQRVDQNRLRVRAGDGMHGVELHGKIFSLQQFANQVKVEDFFQQRRVIFRWRDDFDFKVAEFRHANFAQVHVWDIRHL
mmetsp:Transcript_2900/g.8904  ORF Transcript_2900/g.8904 Transcript_2900/m.8904 type:complete len:413 (-) Transcript_2900:552-1790(-)